MILNLFKKTAFQKTAILLVIIIMVFFLDEREKMPTSKFTQVQINEICSCNSIVLDGCGRTCDWIELYNAGNDALSLKDWCLSPTGIYNYSNVFQDITIDSGEYMIVFCSSEEKVYAYNDVHANFSISSTKAEKIYLFDNNKRIVDEIVVPSCEVSDMSYSKCEGKWSYMASTCGRENGTEIVKVQAPKFSSQSGFYSESICISIDAANESNIYYTLDGSEPTQLSSLYTSSFTISDATNSNNVYSMIDDISTGFLTQKVLDVKQKNNLPLTAPGYQIPNYKVDKAVIIRAVAYDKNGNKSNISTASYFIGYQDKSNYDKIPVISLVTEPDNLFDNRTGIYVYGDSFDSSAVYNDPAWQWWPANYLCDWERDAHIDYFDEDKEHVFSQEVGIRIKGGGSRGYIQKSINLYARKAYDGNDTFLFSFFNNQNVENSVTLYNGGDDYAYKMKDVLINELTANLNVSTMQTKPCYVFIDGEYWGIYSLTEKYSTAYVESKYGVSADDVIIVKNDIVSAGTEDDMSLYTNIIEYARSSDLSNNKHYDYVSSKFDIDSLIDYFCINIYIAHKNDWPYRNYAVWRSRTVSNTKYQDGKWRWMIFDVNSTSMNYTDVNDNTFKYVNSANELFCALMKNSMFKKQFYDRLTLLMDTVFDSENVLSVLDDLALTYREPMADFYKRYFGSSMSIEDFDLYVDDLKLFFTQRNDNIEILWNEYSQSVAPIKFYQTVILMIGGKTNAIILMSFILIFFLVFVFDIKKNFKHLKTRKRR